MILKKLTLKNFRGIAKTTVKFHPKMNVIIGVNGSGKTTILDAVALLLNRTLPIFNEKPSFDIRKDIMIKKTSSNMGLEFRSKLYNKTGVSTVSCEGFINEDTEYNINFEDSKNKITKTMREGDFLDNAPLIAYYPIGRAVTDVSIKADNESTFNQIDAYENCLTGHSNFQVFFRWYRLIDDIYNENIMEKLKVMPKGMVHEMIIVMLSDILKNISKDDKPKNYKYKGISEEMLAAMRVAMHTDEQDISKDSTKNNPKDIEDIKKRFEEISSTPVSKETYYILLSKKKNNIENPLEFVEKAILECTGFSSLSLDRAENKLLLKKDDDILDMNMLSHGEKIYIALVGDIARRLTMLNPKLKNPLEGDGVILIDEIELHLHPKWQREILGKLQDIFPNCQFIVTTHSPQVLHSIKSEEMFFLKNFVIEKLDIEIYGKTSNQILEYIMDTPKRDLEVQKQIDHIYELIDEEEYENAKNAFDELESEMIEDPEITRLNHILNRFSKVSTTK